MTGHELYILGVIAVLVVSSFLTRAGYFLFGDHLPLSDSLLRALRYAPTAALAAIIVPELLPWHSGIGGLLDLRVGAVLIAILVFWRTRSTVMVIVGGMVGYWVLRALAQSVGF